MSNGVEIIQAEAFPDHIHMLVNIPPSLSVALYGIFKREKQFDDI